MASIQGCRNLHVGAMYTKLFCYFCKANAGRPSGALFPYSNITLTQKQTHHVLAFGMEYIPWDWLNPGGEAVITSLCALLQSPCLTPYGWSTQTSNISSLLWHLFTLSLGWCDGNRRMQQIWQDRLFYWLLCYHPGGLLWYCPFLKRSYLLRTIAKWYCVLFPWRDATHQYIPRML